MPDAAAERSEWATRTLGELATITLGGTPSTEVSSFWGGNVPWMASGDVHLRIVDDVPRRITQLGLRLSNATLVDPPCVAIALAGQGKTRGTVAFVRTRLATNQSIAMLKGLEALDTRYLFHDLDRRYEELRARSSGGGRGGLSRGVLSEIPVKLPPLPEQRQIATILDTIDEAIRKTEQIIAKLKQVKQGLLHDLLTRGIDDNGELRDPDRHPEQFKDSALGRIPKEWKVGGLTDVGATDRQAILTGPFGAQLGSADFVGEGVPVLRIGNVQWGRLDLADLLFVRPDKANAMERWRIRAGDLLFARQGATTGRNTLATEDSDGALINYHIIRVAFETAKCHPTFMCALFNSPIVQQQANREKGRGTREGVNTSTLTSFVLPLPAKGEQDQIAGVLEMHDGKVEAEELSYRKLQLLKTGLMEDLLTGRVRVTKLLESAAE